MELAAAAALDPPPAAVADYSLLPRDVLHDILVRLPAAEVCRMRLVCRTWRSLTSDLHFARAHASRHPEPHVIVVRHHVVDHDHEAADVCAIDLHGNIVKRVQIRQPIVGPLSIHGDLLCASHGWKLTSVVDMVTGAVADVGVDRRKKVNKATPYCVLGHVPATGEYKVLRIQADNCWRQQRQMCEVVTLGVAGEAVRWRRRTCPPVTLILNAGTRSENVVAVAGLVYFLDCWGALGNEKFMRADSLVVFDLATEEWKPKALRGPITSWLLAREDDGKDHDELITEWKIPYHLRANSLPRTNFQLARLDETLVVLCCNPRKSLTMLWFLEDMVDDSTARWSKRYTLRCTPFGHDKFHLQYHYPLAVLDEGRILVWVERTCALKAYDPETCTWTDLATLTGDSVVGMHFGSLLCSNRGAARP